MVLLDRRIRDSPDDGHVGRGLCGPCRSREPRSRSGRIPTPLADSFRIDGYELIEELKLLEHAPKSPSRRSRLHSADQCPEGTFDIVLDSSQLALQIHESVGHPIELDRVLGMEANFAGTSFLTLDKLRTLKYGSDIVNVVADATEAHGPGLGTFAYDDEGVAAQCTPIITNGLFTGYLTSRDTAAAIGATRSGGCLRAESWNRLPIVRMTNVSILPGTSPLTLEQLIASTERGIADGDESLLVDRRQALQLSVRLRDWLGDCWRQTRPHAEEPVVLGHHDRVLEFDGRHLLAR